MQLKEWENEIFESKELKQKVMNYITLAFDKDSEFYKELMDNSTERRRRAADKAGFKRLETGLFDSYVENFINSQDVQVNRMTVEFLKFQKNDDWTEIILNENFLFETVFLIMNPLSDEEKDKDVLQSVKIKAGLLQEVSNVKKRLKDLKKEFYGDDSDIIIGITPQNAKKR